MKCPRCQHENPADAVFCQECGSRLEEACPGCGTANRLDAKFCKKCGQAVAVMPPAATAAKFLELRGRLAAAVGDAPSSDRTLREALDLYRAIGATGHAERLARELDA